MLHLTHVRCLVALIASSTASSLVRGAYATWVERTGGPGPRVHHAVAYDGTWERMVLFGGKKQSGEVVGDTWLWEGQLAGSTYSGTWDEHEVTPPFTAPSKRYGHAMAFSGRVGVVLFGGRDDVDPNRPLPNDVREWQTSRWEVFAEPVNDPQPREALPPRWPGDTGQWTFNAASQFMPAMAFDRAGHLGISWLDRQDDVYDGNGSPPDHIMNQSYRCYFAWSIDGGESWHGNGSERTHDVPGVSVDPRAYTPHEGSEVPWVPGGPWYNTLVSLGGYREMGAWGRKFLPVWVDLEEWPKVAPPSEVHHRDFAIIPDPPEPQQIGDIHGALVEVTAPIPPDFAPDCDVDLADFLIFQQCFAGSGNPPAPTCPPGVNADLDGEGDVDMADFILFQTAFTGALDPCDDDACVTGGSEEGGEGAMGFGPEPEGGAPGTGPEPIPDELYRRLYEYCRRSGIPFS